MSAQPMNDEPPARNVIAAFVLVVIAIIIGVVLLLGTRPQTVEIVINPPVPTVTPPPSATPAPLQIYVSGAVANPQITLELPPGSRVEDALRLAGGAAPDADMSRVNPVGILRDGDHVHVFRVGEGDAVALPTAGGGGIVYVNSATLEELITLPGIGPVTAQAILDYRTENGPFARLEDLDNVSGIGPATLANIAALVMFE